MIRKGHLPFNNIQLWSDFMLQMEQKVSYKTSERGKMSRLCCGDAQLLLPLAFPEIVHRAFCFTSALTKNLNRGFRLLLIPVFGHPFSSVTSVLSSPQVILFIWRQHPWDSKGIKPTWGVLFGKSRVPCASSPSGTTSPTWPQEQSGCWSR